MPLRSLRSVAAAAALVLAVEPVADAARSYHAACAERLWSPTPSLSGDGVDAPSLADSGEHVARSSSSRRSERFKNKGVLERLFEHTHVFEDYDSLDDSHALGAPHYDEVDDAFLGVVARLMNLIDETKNGKVCKRDLVALSHVDEYPEFEGFIEELCTEADHGSDGHLDGEEVEAFLELLRAHVAAAVATGQSDEDMRPVLRLLDQHPNGGIRRDILVEAATSEYRPELRKLVDELFVKADRDRDGVLNKMEADTFSELMHDALLALDAQLLADDGSHGGPAELPAAAARRMDAAADGASDGSSDVGATAAAPSSL